MVQIKLTPKLKIYSFIFILISLLCTFWFTIQFIHYSQIVLLNKPSLVGQPNSKKSNYLLNIVLYTLFIIQHIVMSKIEFKKKMCEIYSLYPVYQRYIFNATSALVYLFIINHSQYENQVLFELPRLISIPFTIFGNIMFLWANIQFSSVLFFPYGFFGLFKLDKIEIDYDFKIKKKSLIETGFYKLCRNPMQTGVLLTIIAPEVYTWDRMVFLGMNFMLIMIGVIKQQQKLQKEYEGYSAYKQRVTNRLIPNLFNLL